MCMVVACVKKKPNNNNIVDENPGKIMYLDLERIRWMAITNLSNIQQIHTKLPLEIIRQN